MYSKVHLNRNVRNITAKELKTSTRKKKQDSEDVVSCLFCNESWGQHVY